MENISEKLVKFLSENEISFSVPGCYSLPDEIVIESINEFITNGKSDLIEKHRNWTYGLWDIYDLKNNRYSDSLYDTDSVKELLELKEFFNDYDDIDYLEDLLEIRIREEEIKKTYKFRRKKGFTQKLKTECLKRDRYKCKKCKSKINVEVDHIIEIIDGGENEINNLQTLCKKCHRIKTNKSIKRRR